MVSGNDIKTARLAHGLNTADAAALIGAKERTWQSWEKAERNMPTAKWLLFNLLVGGKANESNTDGK